MAKMRQQMNQGELYASVLHFRGAHLGSCVMEPITNLFLNWGTLYVSYVLKPRFSLFLYLGTLKSTFCRNMNEIF